MGYSNISELLNMHMDKSSNKRKESYGLKLAKSIFEGADKSSSGFFGKRYTQWKTNREFSYGTNSTKEFMDKMNIEGNESFVKIDFSTVKIAPKFVEILLGKYMSRREKPKVSANDDMSLSIKEMEKQEALFRMKYKDKIQALESEMGSVIESDKYIPDDEDSMALYFDLEYRLPEEILFQKLIKNVLDNNRYSSLKRQILRDVIDVNMAVTKIEYDPNGNIVIKRVKPENTIYNVFETDNGIDISYIGEVSPMKLSYIRRAFNLPEEKLCELAQQASRDNKNYDNVYWRESYKYDETRPYDDYSVMVFDFEIKTTDVEYFVKTENQYGNLLVVPKQNKPVAPEGANIGGEILEEKRMNVYHGIWVVNSNIMLKWGLSNNILRPYQNGIDAYLSYSVVCPNANGDIVPSMIEKAMSPIKQMILIRLKMQQLIAAMRPDGLEVDIAGLREVDLGLGNSISPLKLKQIYDQTGVAYWDSTGMDGEQKTSPYRAINSNGSVVALNTLIGQYNFELDRLREEMGISEYADASSVPAKTGLGVMQNQLQASNNATEYIYDAFSLVMEETCKKVAMMLWDTIVFKANKYKEAEGYSMSLLDASFDVKVEMMPDDTQRAELARDASIALQAGLISYEQAFKVKNIEDIKLAELYLAKSTEKTKKEAAATAQKNSEVNAQLQQQSAQMKMQADAQIEQLGVQGKMAINKNKADADKGVELIKLAAELVKSSVQSGQSLPENYQALVDGILGAAMAPPPEPQEQQESAQEPQE